MLDHTVIAESVFQRDFAIRNKSQMDIFGIVKSHFKIDSAIEPRTQFCDHLRFYHVFYLFFFFYCCCVSFARISNNVVCYSRNIIN